MIFLPFTERLFLGVMLAKSLIFLLLDFASADFNCASVLTLIILELISINDKTSEPSIVLATLSGIPVACFTVSDE